MYLWYNAVKHLILYLYNFLVGWLTVCRMRPGAHACSRKIVRDHAIAFENIMEFDDWWASLTQASSLAISVQFTLLPPRD